MPEYRKSTPEPQPIRHTYRLTEDEVIRAIESWLVAQGHTVPDGKRYLLGLDRGEGLASDESGVMLEIDESPPS